MPGSVLVTIVRPFRRGTSVCSKAGVNSVCWEHGQQGVLEGLSLVKEEGGSTCLIYVSPPCFVWMGVTRVQVIDGRCQDRCFTALTDGISLNLKVT